MLGLVLLLAVSAPKTRVFIDAGHGHGTNSGARAADCEDEQVSNLRVARALADRLEKTGRYRVKVSRDSHDGPSYPARLRAASRWRADAIVSIHADARGSYGYWAPSPGLQCPRSEGSQGFAVLWSDDGEDGIVSRRLQLARALARRMAERDLRPYDGADYVGLYDTDEVPGVFTDRRGLFMLRKPEVPSVIIETHQSFSLDEVLSWRSEETFDTLASAVAAALEEIRDGTPRQPGARRASTTEAKVPTQRRVTAGW